MDFRFLKEKSWLILLVASLIFFFLFARLSIRNFTPTADEEKHYKYGDNLLHGDTDRFDDSKMPFSAFNAFPKRIGDFFPEGRVKHFLQTFQTARTVTTLFSTLVALLVFLWSKELFGVKAGFFSLVLYMFDPNIIAHSSLVTTDIYITGMLLASLYCFWRYMKNPNWRTLVIVAVVVGVSQVAKYTGVFLYPLLLLIYLIFHSGEWSALIRSRKMKDLGVKIGIGLGHAAVIVVVSIVIINFAYLFNRTFTPVQEYEFRSELFPQIQETLSFLPNLAVPTPYPYLEGLDWVFARERTGAGYGDIYMLGEIRSGEGFAGYYFVAAALKTPIATLIFIFTALFVWIRKPDILRFREDGQFILIPLLFFSIYFNFFYRAQIGIRFFLIVYPFLYVFCGLLLRNWSAVTMKQRVAGGLLLVYLLVSVGSYYPYYIPYFNEIVWDRKMAYKYLADSNLDWEFGKKYLQEYLESHPEAVFEPEKRRSGTVVVSVNQLVGVSEKRKTYAWLRNNFEPVDTIVHEYLIYEITPEALEAIR